MVVLILVFKAPKELKLKGVKTAIFKSNIHKIFQEIFNLILKLIRSDNA